MATLFLVAVDKVYRKRKARYHEACELEKRTGVRRNVDSRGTGRRHEAKGKKKAEPKKNQQQQE